MLRFGLLGGHIWNAVTFAVLGRLQIAGINCCSTDMKAVPKFEMMLLLTLTI